MAGLAESSLDPPPSARAWWRALIVIVIVALFGAAAYGLRTLVKSPGAAKRQVARISILPDTPPPPPPPPKEEKKPEPPKEEPKQVVREEQLKQDVPKPANEPIKMEGAAGDGPSAFGSGTVNKEYQGGVPLTGASGAGASVADRAEERFYANTARQLLRDEIEKHLKPESGQVVVTFSVWIDSDGKIRKIELAPDANPAATDSDLRTALDETSRQLRLPSHNGLTQPLRFRLTMRAAG